VSGTVTRGSVFARATTFSSPGDMLSDIQSIGHVSLLKFTSARAAFARPGPGAAPVPPTSSLVRSPPTPPSPSTAAPVSPCLRPTLAWMLVLCGATCVASAGRARIHGREERPEMDDRLSVAPDVAREKWGPPRFLDRPLVACRGRTPRRVRPALAQYGQAAVVFE